MDSNNIQPQGEVVAPVVVKNKKSKGLIDGITILGALAVAGLAFGAYSFIGLQKKNDEIADLKDQINSITVRDDVEDGDVKNKDTKNDDEPEEEVDYFAIKDTEVKTLVNELRDIYLEYIDDISTVSTNDYYVGTKARDLKTLTSTEKAYGFKAKYNDNLDTIGKAVEKIDEELIERGFKSEESYYGSKKYYDESNGIRCSADNSSAATVVCAYEGWVSDETIATINELASAVKEVNGEYPYYLGVMKDHKIIDSEVSPYQRWTVSGFDAAALFYRVSPTSEWKFFTYTQAELDCDDYNTDDLKKAYAGEQCYNAATGDAYATVKP